MISLWVAERARSKFISESNFKLKLNSDSNDEKEMILKQSLDVLVPKYIRAINFACHFLEQLQRADWGAIVFVSWVDVISNCYPRLPNTRSCNTSSAGLWESIKNRKVWVKWPGNIVAEANVSQFKAAKCETQKPSTCCVSLFRCKFLPMFPVFHHAWSTCHATETFVAGWRKLLQKVECGSTLSDKCWLCCSFLIKLTTCRATNLLVP